MYVYNLLINFLFIYSKYISSLFLKYNGDRNYIRDTCLYSSFMNSACICIFAKGKYFILR